MGQKVGLDCKFYRNTGTYGTPTWNEITPTKDCTLALDKGKADGSSRASRWRQHMPTLKSAPITFNVIADTAIDDYNSLRDAFINDTVVDFAMADGAIATVGTQYFRADYYVFGFSRGESLEDVATVDVSIDMAVSSNSPGFTTVS